MTLPGGLQSSSLSSKSNKSSPAAEKMSFSGIPGNFLNSTKSGKDETPYDGKAKTKTNEQHEN